MNCGCKIKTHECGALACEHKVEWIVFCPIHAHAHELKEALEELAFTFPDEKTGQYPCDGGCVIIAKEALAHLQEG